MAWEGRRVVVLPTSARVLAVFAHPDDEALSAGGLLARQAAAGTPTAVVTATWAGGTRRAEELAAALDLLGAGPPRLLGYADERVPGSAPGRPRLVDVPLSDVVALLVDQVRDVRPDVVVTHDRHGGITGHPDHRRTHEITVAAARAASVPVILATHPHSARTAVGPVVGAGRMRHTVPDEDVVALDVTPWLDTKVAAVLAHAAEVERGALPSVVAGLAPADRVTLLGTEWYARLCDDD
jgi:N-acetyl-1-D-myo-inositol-2-amino-2-deoxy-alpha-D-glucopyranoside deacetylase